MADQITVLAHKTALACKRWYLGPEGQLRVQDYQKQGITRFACNTLDVEDADALFNYLEQLRAEKHAFIIRGELVPGRDPDDVRRTKKQKRGEPPYFRERARQWVMVDCDQVLESREVEDLDLARPEDCEEGVSRLLKKMPPELRAAGCWWHLSNSAGFKPGVRAHLWFWLDRPMGWKDLDLWAERVNDEAGRRLIDPAVFETVQEHYTADPLLDDGVVDPVGKRSGRRPGPALSLPRVAERKDGYKLKLAHLRDPRCQATHPHLRDAAASYFCARGPDADAGELLRAMRGAVQERHRLAGAAGEETIYDEDKLQSYVDGAREFASERATQRERLQLAQDGTPKPTIENARALLASAPEWDGVLAKNERGDRIEALARPPFEDGYAGPQASYPRAWTDTDDLRVVAWLQRAHGLAAGKDCARAAVDLVASETVIEPVRDYLLAQRWDGEPRIDFWLQVLLGVPDSRYARRVGAMWLVQAVARTLEPGCKADGVLVLEGGQGLRKSSFLRDLCGGLRYFREGIGDIHQKDTLLAMASAWVVEMRENPGISGREIEAYKTFIDRQDDFYRAPYDARPQSHLRRCVLAATTNLEQYLRDDTGARRWWPVTCAPADPAEVLDQLAEVRNQLWAEAVARYRAAAPGMPAREDGGEQWWVEADDPDFVREQDQRFEEDEREDALRRALDAGCCRPRHTIPGKEFAHPPIPEMAAEVTVAQVLYHHWHMSEREQDKRAQMAIAGMLKHMGWARNARRLGKTWTRPLKPDC